jgi:quercetin dioxygenase-like cupin family protein
MMIAQIIARINTAKPEKPKHNWRVANLFITTQAHRPWDCPMDGAICHCINKESQMKRYYSEDEPLTVLPELDQPLLQSNLAVEIEKLRLAESWQRKTGRSSKTLLNSPASGILLIAMKQNTETKEHQVDGRITIQTIVGHLRLKLSDQTVELPAGDLLMLDRGIVHDIQAVKESVFLLTMCWHGGARSASGN